MAAASGRPDAEVEVLPGAPAPAGSARYFPGFLDKKTADALLVSLLAAGSGTASASADAAFDTRIWQRELVGRGGKLHEVRRRTCHFGAPGSTYTYAGLTRAARPWGDVDDPATDATAFAVSKVRQAVEARLGRTFTFCVCNLYEDGGATIGKHSDNERDLEPGSVIASVSLGATRTFAFHPKPRANRVFIIRRHTVELQHGSLLVMDWDSQKHWLHELPKRVNRGPRVNLTFRVMRLPAQPLPEDTWLLPITRKRERPVDDDDDGPPPLEPMPADHQLLAAVHKRDDPPEKRFRKTGPLDAFFSSSVAVPKDVEIL